MKTKTHEITIALLLLALSGAAVGQEQNRFLALPVAELAQTWLLRNCGITEEPLLEAAIVRRGSELQPLFSRAWDDGPPQSYTLPLTTGELFGFTF